MKRNTTIMLILIILIIGVISVITYLKDNKLDEELAKCIASKSQLYVKTGCAHCQQQEQILGSYLSYFNVTDCLISTGICTDKMIEFIPAWIINNQKYYGVKTPKQLKALTGC